MKKMTDLSGWSIFLIACLIGMISNILLVFIPKLEWHIALFSVLNIALTVLLLNSLRATTRFLHVFTNDLSNSSVIKEPRLVLIDDVIRSLRKYGYIKTVNQEEEIKSILKDGQYIRSQNFYEKMNKGIGSVTSKFYFINDHSFKPFSDMVMNNIVKTAKYIGISAIPDELYSVEDIKRRLDLINDQGTEYYLLPKEDVHLSILIFDDRAALICPTPLNRQVCDFSEGLFFSTTRSIQMLVDIFFHIASIAKEFDTHNRVQVVQEMKSFVHFNN